MDKNGKKCKIPETKFKWIKTEKVDYSRRAGCDENGKIVTISENLEEFTEPFEFKKNISPHWRAISNTVFYSKGKSNLL